SYMRWLFRRMARRWPGRLGTGAFATGTWEQARRFDSFVAIRTKPTRSCSRRMGNSSYREAATLPFGFGSEPAGRNSGGFNEKNGAGLAGLARFARMAKFSP